MKRRVGAAIGAVVAAIGVIIGLVFGLGKRRPAGEERQRAEESARERLTALGYLRPT